MIGILTGFVEELREVGIPVSMVEAVDAAQALGHIDLADREAVRTALSATLVKNPRHRGAFDVAFDVYFGLAAAQPGEFDEIDEAMEQSAASMAGGGTTGSADTEELMAAIIAALSSNDREVLRALIRRAVSELAGMQPGRPVGGRYYLYRVMRRLGADQLMERLMDALVAGAGDEADDLDERLRTEMAEAMAEEFRSELRQEIVSRLVADRGREAVAATLRQTLVEDLDLMHAGRDELAEIERAVEPLARKLASRLAQRRKRGRKGRLDVRRTIRSSLAHGGVLLEPRFKVPRVSKPEIVLICDVSGSMATFARFTMQLVHAIASQFSKVRSFAFIDDLDEVTPFFQPGVDFAEALVRMGTEAQLVWRDGHSDYGHSLDRMWEHWSDAVDTKTTVIVTGDARNNYRDLSLGVFDAMAETAKNVFWLNPEPERYWDTGDSVMGKYGSLCDGVHEVRTLRQLERFIEEVAMAPAKIRKAPGILAHGRP